MPQNSHGDDENAPGAGLGPESLLECLPMTNWRQVQARIRKARSGVDPAAKLSELYQKTRDAMVAFELAELAEKAAQTEEAIRWYTTAAERFRREQWRKKCHDALMRLGAAVPERILEQPADSQVIEATVNVAAEAERAEEVEATPESESGPAANSTETLAKAATESKRHRRRRGRRGGRKHRRRSPQEATATKTAELPMAAAGLPAPRESREPQPERRVETDASPVAAVRVEFEEPKLPSERAAYGRASEPALASRTAKLESLLRRLLTGPLHRLDELEDAPAGPGVFLLSDSDLTTSYYVEACQTLRVGLANLTRGGKSRRGKDGPSLKARLAEHLEISENKVSDYLNKHCVVRWLQLDEDAHHLAHFAIAVLRTPLNAD